MTTYYLCRKRNNNKAVFDVLGIDSKIIHSTENGEHAWNVVKIDGKWYHLDVTFDGGVDSPDYAYFNVPDTAKDDDSYPWNKEDFLNVLPLRIATYARMPRSLTAFMIYLNA